MWRSERARLTPSSPPRVRGPTSRGQHQGPCPPRPPPATSSCTQPARRCGACRAPALLAPLPRPAVRSAVDAAREYLGAAGGVRRGRGAAAAGSRLSGGSGTVASRPRRGGERLQTSGSWQLQRAPARPEPEAGPAGASGSAWAGWPGKGGGLRRADGTLGVGAPGGSGGLEGNAGVLGGPRGLWPPRPKMVLGSRCSPGSGWVPGGSGLGAESGGSGYAGGGEQLTRSGRRPDLPRCPAPSGCFSIARGRPPPPLPPRRLVLPSSAPSSSSSSLLPLLGSEGCEQKSNETQPAVYVILPTPVLHRPPSLLFARLHLQTIRRHQLPSPAPRLLAWKVFVVWGQPESLFPLSPRIWSLEQMGECRPDF